MNGKNAFPTRYWRKGTLENFERITVETMLEEHGTRNEVCPPCVMKCVKHNFVFEGRHKGLECEGPEYETAYVFGGLCEIDDFAEIMWLNDICDRLGVDTMSAGNLCALAIEASRARPHRREDGLGDPDCVAEFLRRCACARASATSGPRASSRSRRSTASRASPCTSRAWSRPATTRARMKGMGLGFATTPRGACHLRATMYKPELMGVIDPREIEGKADIYCDWEDRLTIMDCLVYCRFYRDLVQWPYITPVVNAVVGTDYTEEDLHRIANRIITMTHEFNAARGIGRESERLPNWVSDKPMEDETRLGLPAGGDGVHARRLLPHPRLGGAARLGPHPAAPYARRARPPCEAAAPFARTPTCRGTRRCGRAGAMASSQASVRIFRRCSERCMRSRSADRSAPSADEPLRRSPGLVGAPGQLGRQRRDVTRDADAVLGEAPAFEPEVGERERDDREARESDAEEDPAAHGASLLRGGARVTGGSGSGRRGWRRGRRAG